VPWFARGRFNLSPIRSPGEPLLGKVPNHRTGSGCGKGCQLANWPRMRRLGALVPHTSFQRRGERSLSRAPRFLYRVRFSSRCLACCPQRASRSRSPLEGPSAPRGTTDPSCSLSQASYAPRRISPPAPLPSDRKRLQGRLG
jgi:hypothetical protein